MASTGSVSYAYYDRTAPNSTWSGRVHTATTGNGVVTEIRYDGSSPRIARIDVRRESGTVVQYERSYDSFGRLVALSAWSELESSAVTNHRKKFTYNSLDQLTNMSLLVDGEIVRKDHYTYRAGNVTSHTVTTSDGPTTTVYEHNELDQIVRAIEDGEETLFSYDDDGNLTAYGDPEFRFVYDPLSRLTEFHPPSGPTFHYDYAADGTRKSKRTNDDDRITFLYDEATNKNIVNEIQGEDVTRYLMSSNRRIARILEPDTRYYVSDGKSFTATASGEDSESWRAYSPYGLELPLAGASTTTPADELSVHTDAFRHNAEYFDHESGLYYLRARYYAPWLKSFMTRDKVASGNRYAFALGDPEGRVDPSGELSLGVLLAEVAGLVAGALEAAIGFGTGNIAMGASGVLNAIGGGLAIAGELADNNTLRTAAIPFFAAGLGVAFGKGVTEGAKALARRTARRRGGALTAANLERLGQGGRPNPSGENLLRDFEPRITVRVELDLPTGQSPIAALEQELDNIYSIASDFVKDSRLPNRVIQNDFQVAFVGRKGIELLAEQTGSAERIAGTTTHIFELGARPARELFTLDTVSILQEGFRGLLRGQGAPVRLRVLSQSPEDALLFLFGDVKSLPRPGMR